MKTEAFEALKQRCEMFQKADHDTQARVAQALRGDVGKAFLETTRENVKILTAANEAGIKASDSRDFERNTGQLAQLKEWQETLAPEPSERSRRLMKTLYSLNGTHGPRSALNAGQKAYGGSPLVMPDEYLRELHEAAATKSYASKAITVSGSPMAAIPQYAVDVFPFLRDRPRLRELIPTEQTDRSSVIYYRGLTAATAAAAVAEGANKPESSPTWESVMVPMTKIAHYGRVNDEVIADYAAWLDVIGGEMLAGVVDAENNMILNGTGTPPEFAGLLNATGIQTQAFATDIITTLATAANKLRTGAAYTEPDVFVLNPANWLTVQLYRTGGSTTSDGPFLMNPTSVQALTLWGVPVVLTNRIAAGTALVANLKAAAEVFVRQDVTLDVHPGGGGAAEWIANQTLIRAEERVALTVPRPAAVVKATVAA